MTTTTMDAHAGLMASAEKSGRLAEIAVAVTCLLGVGTAFTSLLGLALIVFVGD
ncbi:MAG: hypothetical protein ACM33T_17065 [Solirubrobacterales bacterium]